MTKAETLFGYHVSHEQFKPSELLKWTKHAEMAGFDCFFSSDHFHPWTDHGGQAGFSWSWMGAALQVTEIPGGLICCPGYRYHPAVVAQAVGTLCEMYPGRFRLTIGSGEALNEAITGMHWPVKAQRNERLRECADVIRALLRGETVTHHGLITVEEAHLYTRPERAPLLVGAAVTAATAEWLGGWADALLTTCGPLEELKKVVEAFQRGGGEGKPMYLQVGLGWGRAEEETLQDTFSQWRNVAFASNFLTELRTPALFDVAGTHVRPEDLKHCLRVSSDLDRHVQWLRDDLSLGFDEIYLHNIGTNQEEFIEVFGEKVLPELRR